MRVERPHKRCVGRLERALQSRFSLVHQSLQNNPQLVAQGLGAFKECAYEVARGNVRFFQSNTRLPCAAARFNGSYRVNRRRQWIDADPVVIGDVDIEGCAFIPARADDEQTEEVNRIFLTGVQALR